MLAMHKEFDSPGKPTHAESDVRSAFPAAAALVDAARAAFGDVKVLLTEENGQVIKPKSYKPDSAFGGSVTASEFIRMGQISRENSAMVEARAKGGGNAKG